MYFGNDIGVYASIDAGLTWVPFDDGLTDATFVMHISHSPSNRKLRIATHGNGVWQRDMLPVTITGIEDPLASRPLTVYPNPSAGIVKVSIPQSAMGGVLELYSVAGKRREAIDVSGGEQTLDLSHLPSGSYILKMEAGGVNYHGRFMISRQ